MLCSGSCVDTTTDPHDCGACGHDCLGVACAAGQCAATSLSVASGVGLLAVDATNLYYAGSSISSLPLAGGAATVISMPDGFVSLAPQALAIDRSNVFWTAADSPNTGYVVSVGKDGLGQRELVNQLASYGKPYGLATLLDASGDATAVVWASHGDGQSPDHPVVVNTSPSGSSTTIATLPVLFANSVALDPSNAYVSSPDGTNVFKVPLAGGATTVFASGFSFPLQVLTDATNLYVLDLGPAVSGAYPTGSLTAVPLAGGPARVLASSLPNVAQMATLGGTVYVTSSYATSSTTADGSILAIPSAGGAPRTLVSGQAAPGAVTVDATYVYWATTGIGGTGAGIWRAPR